MTLSVHMENDMNILKEKIEEITASLDGCPIGKPCKWCNKRTEQLLSLIDEEKGEAHFRPITAEDALKGVSRKKIFGMKTFTSKYNEDKLVAETYPEWDTKKIIYEQMLKNFCKGNYMDKQADKCDCRNCYIKGFNDCMSKLKALVTNSQEK